jgi:hypothetical protein
MEFPCNVKTNVTSRKESVEWKKMLINRELVVLLYHRPSGAVELSIFGAGIETS